MRKWKLDKQIEFFLEPPHIVKSFVPLQTENWVPKKDCTNCLQKSKHLERVSNAILLGWAHEFKSFPAAPVFQFASHNASASLRTKQKVHAHLCARWWQIVYWTDYLNGGRELDYLFHYNCRQTLRLSPPFVHTGRLVSSICIIGRNCASPLSLSRERKMRLFKRMAFIFFNKTAYLCAGAFPSGTLQQWAEPTARSHLNADLRSWVRSPEKNTDFFNGRGLCQMMGTPPHLDGGLPTMIFPA